MQEGRLRRLIVIATTSTGGIILASCSSDRSVMNPQSDEADRISTLGWLMLGVAALVFCLVIGLLLSGLVRGRAAAARHDHDHDHAHAHRATQHASRWVLGGGVVLPSVVVLSLSVLTVWALDADRGEPTVHIDLVGHQFWWEIRYEGSEAVTANELHMPVDEDVRITLTSVDVIHSLWVPELGPKLDLVPGETNHLTWHARNAGTYGGLCAEFCGLQHANMALDVVVEPRDQFEQWLAAQSTDAATPQTQDENDGRAAFLRQSCSKCHTIRGTPASATDGPDLTHLASRQRIGAGVAPNDRGHLAGWIVDSQSLKPGNLMPPIPVSPDELRTILAYLESLE